MTTIGPFDNEAVQAARDAHLLDMTGTTEGSGPRYHYDAGADVSLKAAVDAMHGQGDPIVRLSEIESDEALNIAAAAFENRVGTTHGVGDGMRAALAALADWRRKGASS